MPFLKREGIILKTRRFGEADKVVVIFSPQSGRFEGIAKGARKGKSRFGGRIEPFNQARFLLYQGRSLPIITQVEVVERFKEIKEDLTLFGVGAEALKIVNEVTLPQKEKEIYFLLLNFLKELRKGKAREALLAAFEIKVLASLGYSLSLNFCSLCEKEREKEEAYFSFNKGGIICSSCFKKSFEEDEEITFLSQISYLTNLLNNPFTEIPFLERERAENILSFLGDCFRYYLDVELTSLRKEFSF